MWLIPVVQRVNKTRVKQGWELVLMIVYCSNLMRAHESRWERMRVSGHAKLRVWTLILVWSELKSQAQTRTRVVESLNSHSRLAWNSHALSATLIDSHALSSNLNLLKLFLRVVESFLSLGSRLIIVDESWIKLSWERTLILVCPGLNAIHRINHYPVNKC